MRGRKLRRGRRSPDELESPPKQLWPRFLFRLHETVTFLIDKIPLVVGLLLVYVLDRYRTSIEPPDNDTAVALMRSGAFVAELVLVVTVVLPKTLHAALDMLKAFQSVVGGMGDLGVRMVTEMKRVAAAVRRPRLPKPEQSNKP